MSSPPALLTLTTDFGQTDHYVGQMKGAILRIAPNATIVDMTHAIPPQNVRAASFLLADLHDAFGPGTVHLAVIDPGVGSSRRIIAIKAGGQFYIAPDNGLLTLVLERFPDARIVEISINSRWSGKISATFHGRDIMAPAAARLARDQRLDELGDPLAGEAIRLTDLHPRQIPGTPSRIEGTIVWADHFGNLITNIPATMLKDANGESLTARSGRNTTRGLRQYYSEVAGGEILMLVGSSGRLEIAANGGSAAASWGARIGATVVVTE